MVGFNSAPSMKPVIPVAKVENQEKFNGFNIKDPEILKKLNEALGVQIPEMHSNTITHMLKQLETSKEDIVWDAGVLGSGGSFIVKSNGEVKLSQNAPKGLIEKAEKLGMKYEG